MPLLDAAWIVPDWPAPRGVRACVSTRWGPGCSAAPFERFNLGRHAGDAPAAVAANRAALQGALGLAQPPAWLRQVHGAAVARFGRPPADEPLADAAVTDQAGTPLAILTADCLPVLLCAADASAVAAAHAGWRGLAAGVLESAVAALPGQAPLMAWLGPCIGAASYEVGEEVRSAFVDADAGAAVAFEASRRGHWLCDLTALARRRLAAAGVEQIHGGGFDTRTDARFYSYRRDGAASGRFASLIWRQAE